MANTNLTALPTVQQSYDRLSAFPVFLQYKESPDGMDTGFSVHPHFTLGDLDPTTITVGMQLNVGGNFILTSIVNGKIVGGDEIEPPFLLSQVVGANRFTIKTTKSVSVDGPWPTVRITTAISVGTKADVTRKADEVDENSNETKIVQDFLLLGKDLDATAVKNAVLSTGFNKIGLAIPSFPDTNALAGALQRFYSSADFTKKPHPMGSGILADFDTAMAAWDSTGDALKAGITLVGGLVGGIGGFVAFGAATGGPGAPFGALAGAAAGSAVASRGADALIPNSWFNA